MPNANWTEDINDLAFISAKIGVFKSEALVPAVDCTISPRSADASVPAAI
jgi:hypothetical protein